MDLMFVGVFIVFLYLARHSLMSIGVLDTSVSMFVMY